MTGPRLRQRNGGLYSAAALSSLADKAPATDRQEPAPHSVWSPHFISHFQLPKGEVRAGPPSESREAQTSPEYREEPHRCIIPQPRQECEPQWTLSNAMLPYKAMRLPLPWCRLSAPGPRCESLKLRDPAGPGGRPRRNARHVGSSSGICFTRPRKQPRLFGSMCYANTSPGFPCESRTYQMSSD